MSTTPPHNDTYLESREIEAQARKEDSPQQWLQFAELKDSKGSYGPATAGYLNAGIAFERDGDAASAIDAYRRGLDVAQKAKHSESVVILSMRLVPLLERTERFDEAGALYEALSAYYAEQESWFLAADAADHAAELFGKAGRDLSSYTLPAELWTRNAEYWAGKDKGDEAWSRRRAAVYLENTK
ncbi:hypothetical protein [Corynebacterium cystitidis]|uniref:hypothetical protein n=1 Tax=Corynebacterium cystitidis TaxID=35757 RepID=UPI00211E9BB0|nr:hypothetical protein [Corynebacterium cystitidis]